MSFTKQESFNHVVTHLLKQREKAITDAPDGEVVCAYRGDGGTKCAVGCLIDDEHYSANIEEYSVAHRHRILSAVKASGHGEIAKCGVLLMRLQQVHDGVSVDSWRDALAKVAADFGLTMPTCPGT